MLQSYIIPEQKHPWYMGTEHPLCHFEHLELAADTREELHQAVEKFLTEGWSLWSEGNIGIPRTALLYRIPGKSHQEMLEAMEVVEVNT